VEVFEVAEATNEILALHSAMVVLQILRPVVIVVVVEEEKEEGGGWMWGSAWSKKPLQALGPRWLLRHTPPPPPPPTTTTTTTTFTTTTTTTPHLLLSIYPTNICVLTIVDWKSSIICNGPINQVG